MSSVTRDGPMPITRFCQDLLRKSVRILFIAAASFVESRKAAFQILIDESVVVTMAAMKSYANAIGLLFGLAMLAGCASTKVTEQTPMTAPGLARPNQIWVCDFVAAPSDMPTDSSLAGQVGAPSTPPTPEEIETGR